MKTMRLLYLLIPHFIQLTNGGLPKELVILARGLVYPKPLFERVEMLRDICEEKREAFFHPFTSNRTKKEIKVDLLEWAAEMEADGHNGTDDSIKVLIGHWEKWREQTEGRVFTLLKEAITVYKEIISSSSHCAVNLSLCQQRFDLLPPRVHRVFDFLTAGGVQLSRSLPSPCHHSNRSFTFPPLNWTDPERNGTNPRWNGSLPVGVNGILLRDDSEETDLIDDMRIEEEREGFSFGNRPVYEEWFNYWMHGIMNTSNWNATRNGIMEWINGNSSSLPRFPTGLMASVVLPNERNWTLEVLNAVERGIEGTRRVGIDTNASVEISTAVADLSRLFSSVTDSFKGNLVEDYVHPSPIPSSLRDKTHSISTGGVVPVDWSSIQSRLVDIPTVDNDNTLKRDAQLMAMDNLGMTDDIMGYLDSLYATAKNSWNELSREKRSPMDVSGSRLDLIFEKNQNVEPSPPPSISSILSDLGSLIGEKMDELNRLGTGLIAQVVNAVTNHTVPNITTISQLPSSFLTNSSSITNHPSLMGNISDLLSNATSVFTTMNHSIPSDFSTAFSPLLSGSITASPIPSSSSPLILPVDLSMGNIISGILDSMDKVTAPSSDVTTYSATPTESSTSNSSKGDSGETVSKGHSTTRESSLSTAGISTQSTVAHSSSASLTPLLTTSSVSHAVSSLSSNQPTVQFSPIPSQSPTNSSFSSTPSASTQRSIVPPIPSDLRDILTGNGFHIPDIKNLSSVVASIDRLNEFLLNRTREMIDSMTRSIEEAFGMGRARDSIVNTLNDTVAQNNGESNQTDSIGVNLSSVSWTDIKDHLWMTPNVSRDDYEYKEYDYEEMEEEDMPARGNISGESEGNGTALLPLTNLTVIGEEDDRVVRSTLMFYDKVNCTLSVLFAIVGNESLSIFDTKRALNSVYWNSTLIQRQMITFLIRNADIPSIDIEEGVKLRGPCSNETERLSRQMDAASLLLMN